MRSMGLVLLFLWLLLPVASFAQTEKVLQGREITENALIEALTPDEQRSVRTRSIKVRPDQPAVAPKPASASLLITFETDSAELTSKAKSSLDVVAQALKADKLAEFKFRIDGHADPRGGHDYNLRLSQARADSVVDYLVSTGGIDRERLKPLGKGDAELLNVARPEAPENRRVTITTLRE